MLWEIWDLPLEKIVTITFSEKYWFWLLFISLLVSTYNLHVIGTIIAENG